MSVAWVGVGVAAAGALASADSARSAANKQSDAAKDSNATQLYMYDKNREDNAPFLANGTAASNKLARLLGVNSGYGSSGSEFVDNSTGIPKANEALYASDPTYRAAWDQALKFHQDSYGTGYGSGSDAGEISDYIGGLIGRTPVSASADPEYGSLLHNFTKSDLEADPVYQSGLQFGLDEGTKGINRQQAATGNLLSGATLKALTKYGNDYASTKAGDAYNRFNNNKQQTFNMLSGISGTGQVANGQVGSAGQNMANNVSQNQIGMGNARAASAIGSANALTGGIAQGYNMYQNNQMMNALANRNSSSYGYGTQRNLGGYDAAANGGWGIE